MSERTTLPCKYVHVRVEGEIGRSGTKEARMGHKAQERGCV